MAPTERHRGRGFAAELLRRRQGRRERSDREDASAGAHQPAVDALRVYAFFESGDLQAFDHDGKLLWQRKLTADYGEFKGNHGIGSSLALFEDRVIVLIDHDGPSYLLALDAATGKNVWKLDRPSKISWTSPIVGNTADQGPAIWYDFFAGGTLKRCTIVFNGGPMGSGSVHFGGFSDATATNNIVAFSSVAAAYHFVPGSLPVLGCNDAFANQGGDAITGGLDLGTNFSLDPLFCDVVAGDYTLRGDSPCGPKGPCGVVGAFGFGACAVVSTNAQLESMSWGRLKSSYR